uniref:Uncharacterized protein n=1 Tax=Meloidogyne enterolobii TaxID=390850 RepID=A0A6V7VF03_MELEN|nr:unnamed protein product [Meloidogyne enterolobii]
MLSMLILIVFVSPDMRGNVVNLGLVIKILVKMGGFVALPPIEDDDEYWEATALDANFTQQLSSGKIEWIEQLKKIDPSSMNGTEEIPNTNLFEQAIGEELPIRALKNSTSKNGGISIKFISKEKIKIFVGLLILYYFNYF